MSLARKARSTRRHKQTRKWIVAASVLLLVATFLAITYTWYSKNLANSSSAQQTKTEPTVSGPPAFKTFIDQYLGIMRSLNSSGTKAEMRPLLSSSYNQTDLFKWEQSKLTFTQDPAGWFDDPIQILNSGKGICEQFSDVYVSACLALGYQSRLVVAANATSWNFIHVWAEDYYNGTWVHVDPSDSVWNNPSRYQSWEWGSAIGSGVKIYAFEDDTFKDVTSSYGAHSG
jgi:transglutaminase-like putative cysteine protease